jgi:hypothetical protein
MKYTKNKVEAILRRNYELMDNVDSFIRSKTPRNERYHVDCKIENDKIMKRVNTACHCHPEYEWVEVGTTDEFVQWLTNQER